jgi:hypothetical protein
MLAPNPLRRRALRAAPFAVLAACCVALALSSGSDFWAAPAFDGADPDADDRELKELNRALQQRIAEKDRLAALVGEGRLALPDAAARFRDLDRQPPPFRWDQFCRSCPGRSDEERHCREVINYVRTLRDPPGRGDAVAARLEAELRDLLDRGDLHLPEAPPASP